MREDMPSVSWLEPVRTLGMEILYLFQQIKGLNMKYLIKVFLVG